MGLTSSGRVTSAADYRTAVNSAAMASRNRAPVNGFATTTRPGSSAVPSSAISASANPEM
jgi:hypothetical protein